MAGDSAGGNLATVLARRLRDDGGAVRARHQTLIYPVCDAARDTPSYREFADGWGLTAEGMAGFWAHYADGADPAAPDLSPGRADDLAGLPPAYVLTAECDVLRDEAEIYAERLRAAGVPVVLRRHPGTVHGFARWLARAEPARQAVAELGTEISAALRA